MADPARTLQDTEAALDSAIRAGDLPPALQERASAIQTRLKQPLRVSVLGMAWSGKTAVLNVLAGQPVLSDALRGATVEFTYADEPRTVLTRRDGTELELEGPPDYYRIGLETPAFVKFEMPVPALRKVSLLELAMPSDPQSQARALRWVSRKTDIAIWCTEAFEPEELALWDPMPSAVKDHAILLRTKADLLGADRSTALDGVLGTAQDEFAFHLALSAQEALLARQADGSIDKNEMRASGGLSLISTMVRQIEQGRQNALDQAEYLMMKAKTMPVVAAPAAPAAKPEPAPEPASPPQVAQPEPAKPEAAKAKAVKPKSAKAEAVKPESAIPEAAKPEAPQSEALKPEVPKPEVKAKPKAVPAPEPEGVKPDPKPPATPAPVQSAAPAPAPEPEVKVTAEPTQQAAPSEPVQPQRVKSVAARLREMQIAQQSAAPAPLEPAPVPPAPIIPSPVVPDAENAADEKAETKARKVTPRRVSRDLNEAPKSDPKKAESAEVISPMFGAIPALPGFDTSADEFEFDPHLAGEIISETPKALLARADAMRDATPFAQNEKAVLSEAIERLTAVGVIAKSAKSMEPDLLYTRSIETLDWVTEKLSSSETYADLRDISMDASDTMQLVKIEAGAEGVEEAISMMLQLKRAFKSELAQ